MSEGNRNSERLKTKMEKDKWIESTLSQAEAWPMESMNLFLKSKIEARLKQNGWAPSPSLAFKGVVIATVVLINFSALLFVFTKAAEPSASKSEPIIQFHYYSYE